MEPRSSQFGPEVNKIVKFHQRQELLSIMIAVILYAEAKQSPECISAYIKFVTWNKHTAKDNESNGRPIAKYRTRGYTIDLTDGHAVDKQITEDRQ